MPKTDKKRLVLLDAHAIIHRAYHALPDFTSSSGEPTGALFGVISMITKIMDELKPDYVVACYDLPGKTFRHDAYEAYKGGRAKTDDALVSQLIKSREVCEAFSIPIYDAPGYEADDMLGTIVEQVKKDKDVEVIIASGDMDTLQLVDKKKVQVYTLRKGIKDTIMYDEKAVIERFGFAPDLLPDYKGLRGDPSDNIPGIRGIGEKTASQIIQAFGSLESLYKVLKKNPEKLAEAKISARMIEKLTEGEEEALFSKTLAEIRHDAPITFVFPEKSWRETIDQKTVEAMLAKFEFRSLLARVRTLFNWADSAVPVENRYEPTDDEVKKIGIAVWLLNSEMTNPTLDDIYQYAGTKDFKKAEQKILAEIEDKKLGNVYREIELPIIPVIAQMEERGMLVDVKHFEKLSKEYHIKLDKLQQDIWKIAGEEFNINSPKQMSEVLFDRMMLSTKGLKKTASGARSTRESELAKLAPENPIIEKILEYRQFQKMLSTYIDNIPKLLDEHNRVHTSLIQTGTTTGRFSSQNPNMQNIPVDDTFGRAIRMGFIASPGYQLVAFDYSQIELRVTALLSEEPNFVRVFQEGGDIHAAVAARVFGASEDKVTNDQRRAAKVINFGIIYGMGVNALRENLGGTREEAQKFYNAYFEQFPGLEAYLESIKTFAYKHGYTETLFGRRRYFPALKSPLPFIRASAERMAVNAPIQGTATADIIKLALRHVDERIRKEGLETSVFPLLQVHDEIIYEVVEGREKEAVALIRDAMEHVFENSYLNYKSTVPIKVSHHIARRWGEMK